MLVSSLSYGAAFSSSSTTTRRSVSPDIHMPVKPTTHVFFQSHGEPCIRIHNPSLRISTRDASTTRLHSSLALPTAGSAGAAFFGLDAAVAGASLAATAKLLSSIGLGGLAAKKNGLLDQEAISALSRLAYWVFQPAFLCVSVATTLAGTASGGVSGGGIPGRILAMMFAASAITQTTALVLSKFVTKAAKFTGDEARDVRMCVTFQNCGPLPLVFADALFSGSLLSDVTSCISFYLLAWSPLFWSVGRMIIGTYGDDDASNKASLTKRFVSEAKKFLSPPVLGAITGLFIGTIPLLRNIFFGGVAVPMFGAMKTLGSAYLPAALLVLAGSLVGGDDDTSSPKSMSVNEDGSEQPMSDGPSPKAIATIMVSRFAISPIVALAFVKLYGGLGLFGTPGTQSFAVASFCLLMQGCMPPAQNSVLMYSLAGLTERASKMAKLLALTYGLAIVPVTILMSACLSISGISAFR